MLCTPTLILATVLCISTGLAGRFVSRPRYTLQRGSLLQAFTDGSPVEELPEPALQFSNYKDRLRVSPYAVDPAEMADESRDRKRSYVFLPKYFKFLSDLKDTPNEKIPDEETGRAEKKSISILPMMLLRKEGMGKWGNGHPQRGERLRRMLTDDEEPKKVALVKYVRKPLARFF